MNPRLSAFVFMTFVALCSCSDKAGGGDSDGDSRCTPGASVECACIDGSRGAQLCAEDGTLEACQCAGQGGTGSGGTAPNGGTSATGAAGTGPFGGTTSGGNAGLGGSSATGGNAGTAALGGTTGLGGTSATGGSASGSGGSGAYGPADSEHIYFDGTVTYEMAGQPSLVRHLTVCLRCEAAYSGTNIGTSNFWVGEDTPQWANYSDMSMTFRMDGIYFRPAEYIEPFYGAYAQDPFGTTSDVPYADSCVHADDRVIADAGHVTGTLDCTLSRRNTDRPAATAHIVGSFHAEFPSQNP